MKSSLELLRDEMIELGFFCPSIEKMDGWERVAVCTRRRSDGRGFAGNSMFITFVNGVFVLGNWLGNFYLCSHRTGLIQFAIEWLAAFPERTEYSFDPNMLHRHQITQISEAKFRLLLQSDQE
jgi:hypothetical protein